MNEQTKIACKDYEKMLLDATVYSGNKEPGHKRFSASMLGSDLLQNFYNYKHGSSDSIQFEANTFGSIYQLGVDLACKDNIQYLSAKRLSHTLDNGWEISGEMDQIDVINKVIFDNKVTTLTTIKSIRKEGKNHGYALQLGVYKWLLSKLERGPYTTVLPVVDKGFSYFNEKSPNQLEFVDVETYDPNEIELMLYEKTNELQTFIDLDEEPAECSNLFWFARKGQRKKKMRCIHYCDYSAKCKYYNHENEYFAERNAVNDLLDL